MYNEEIKLNKAPNPTAKQLLEDMDYALKGLGDELRMINDAIHGTQPKADTVEVSDGCLIDTMIRQRCMVDGLLKLAVHIREGLW